MNRIISGLARLLCIVALLSLTTAPAFAQRSWPVSFELTYGPGYVHADQRYDYIKQARPGVRASFLLAVNVADAGAGRIVVAGDISAQGRGSYEAKAICYALPDGRCRKELPDFRMLSGLVGWESARRGFRSLAGPVYVYEVGRGFQARIDGAAPVTGRLAFTLGLRGVLVDYRDRRFQLVAAGLGIRIQ